MCDEGNQKRDVVCLGKIQNEFVSVPEHNCKPEEKPIPIQRCKLPECSATWYTTEWSMVRLIMIKISYDFQYKIILKNKIIINYPGQYNVR